MTTFRQTSLNLMLLRITVFLLVFLLVFLARNHRLNDPQAFMSDEGVTLYLEERTGLDELIAILESEGVLFDEESLRWASGLLGWRNFNPGRYELGERHTYQELLSKLALGLQDHVSVTIPPGISEARFSALLGRELIADSAGFASLFNENSPLAAEMEISPEGLFGRMLPDTYNIYWTTEPERVLRRILRDFNQRVVERFADEIETHSLDLDELITLASIVEWEATRQEEKPVIAGLYLNRLHRNMRLQADPTVIYAIGEHRRLLFRDYEIDHPYNTYRINGLPPGPITNPDFHSLEAAIRPGEHNYLYMVANPEGGHVFSRTFEEHRRASAEWRRWIEEQYRIRRELETAGESNG